MNPPDRLKTPEERAAWEEGYQLGLTNSELPPLLPAESYTKEEMIKVLARQIGYIDGMRERMRRK